MSWTDDPNPDPIAEALMDQVLAAIDGAPFERAVSALVANLGLVLVQDAIARGTPVDVEWFAETVAGMLRLDVRAALKVVAET